MTKLTLEQQELLFANDCKLINLRYEYHGYTGTEKWAIVTELAEEELWVKYPDVIRRYTPFILLSMAQGEVIDESYRNNDKYEKRAKRTIDVYGYEDDMVKVQRLFAKTNLKIPVIRSVDVLIFLRYTPSKRSVLLWVEKFMASSMTWQKY